MWVCLQRVGECFYRFFCDGEDYQSFDTEAEGDEEGSGEGQQVGPMKQTEVLVQNLGIHPLSSGLHHEIGGDCSYGGVYASWIDAVDR